MIKTQSIIEHPLLFKQTSHGKIQQWRIEQDGARYRSISGQSDGKQTTSMWTICTGKNVGKSNETSDSEQCLLEIQSLYRKQLDKAYTLDPGAVKESRNEVFQPMLAKKFEDYYPIDDVGELPNIEVGIQSKLDGIRCIITAERMFSRKNKDFYSIPHIRKALERFFIKYPSIYLDGELYNHDLRADFNQITSIVKKQKPSAKDLAESMRLIQYWIYDFYDPTRPNMTFLERTKFLNKALSETKAVIDGCLKLTPTYIDSIKASSARLELFLADGYEGAMIRDLSSVYQQKRTKDLLKYKIFTEEEFEVLELEEGKGNLTGCAASVKCIATNGQSFNAGVMGDRAYLRRLWIDRQTVIGQPATIKYFNLTPDGIPRFGKCKTIRDYE